MIEPEAALQVACPECGAPAGAPCLFGNRGKASASHERRTALATKEQAIKSRVVRMPARNRMAAGGGNEAA